MTRERIVRFIVPQGVDDPELVSGGNVYDRRVRDGLAGLGWDVSMTEAADADAVAVALDEVPRGSTVLIDGLVAGWAPSAIEAAAAQSRVIVLAHMVMTAFPDPDPEAADSERRALGQATRVIATSEWTASELILLGIVDEDRVSVAVPGAVDGPVSRGRSGGLLCVGAVAPHKGQDILLDALGRVRDLDWTCTVAGSRTADPDFARRIATSAAPFGARIQMPGVLHDEALQAAYQCAGVLVAPSRAESFGMAIADARRRGLPVIAAAVGGIPEAVAGGGALLVKTDDPAALATALEQWMTDPTLRARLRSEAAEARARSPRWSDTVERIDRVLAAA